MIIAAIIQARTGSSRLPGKVLKQIKKRPMLELQILRVKHAKKIDKILVATTRKVQDTLIVAITKRCGVDYFRGSEKDVLDRYYRAAQKIGADIVVRLTGDCPLSDPMVIDETVSYFLRHRKKIDYLTNPVNYPEGLDTEIFTFRALREAWRKAKKSSEREHVTAYFKNHPERFRSRKWRKGKGDFSHFHWSVDEARDLKFVRAVYNHLWKGNKKLFLKGDILRLISKHPELTKINEGLTGYEGYYKSLEEDKSYL